jgi:hypothetical protein
MASNELGKYLQTVTDKLAGQLLRICTADDGLPPEAAKEAEHLSYVWDVMHDMDCPEPDDAVMARLYQEMLNRADSMELDEDELDLVVGAGKPEEPPTSEE